MSYRIENENLEDVEVREISIGDYFEFSGDVYQRVSVAANFNVVVKPDGVKFPIYALCLENNSVCFFSELGRTVVTPLHETSPIALTRRKP